MFNRAGRKLDGDMTLAETRSTQEKGQIYPWRVGSIARKHADRKKDLKGGEPVWVRLFCYTGVTAGVFNRTLMSTQSGGNYEKI